MDLLEPALQPAQLRGVNGSVRATRIAHGVERDVADRALVMHVVRIGGEAVPALTDVGVDELGTRDRPALGVGRDLHRGTGEELLGVLHEKLHHALGIQSCRRLDRLARPGHRARQHLGYDADPLANLFVVAIAAKPRYADPFRPKRLHRLFEQTGMWRKSKRALKQVSSR